jgi:hypothetical protein
MTLWCRVVVVCDHPRLVLSVSSAVEKCRVLSLAVLSGTFTHALVELVELSLGALRHGGVGGGGAEIHWIEAEHGRARCVNDNIGWCCSADGSHGGGREEGRKGEHDDGDGDGDTKVSDKNDCMTDVERRKGGRESAARKQYSVRRVTRTSQDQTTSEDDGKSEVRERRMFTSPLFGDFTDLGCVRAF